MSRLQTYYKETVVKQLTDQFGYGSPMQVPRITKVTLNMGLGEAVADKKVIDAAVADMTKISGQKPVITVARKSVSNFKIREGYPIGCKVTLRRERMYEFLDRLISIAIPRIRDFRGLNNRSFDGQGNYSMGIKEQIIFPEIDYDKIDQPRGMDISIVTTARTRCGSARASSASAVACSYCARITLSSSLAIGWPSWTERPFSTKSARTTPGSSSPFAWVVNCRTSRERSSGPPGVGSCQTSSTSKSPPGGRPGLFAGSARGPRRIRGAAQRALRRGPA